jgi:uncharacterized protein (TIGR03435 family)
MVTIAGLTFGTFHTFGQTASTRPEFEVASIKLNKSAGRLMTISPGPGGRFAATNIPLQILIIQAFQLRLYQLSGVPSWLMSERYDVAAEAEGSPTEKEMLPMMQRLLEERLRLKYHRETREMPVYALVVARPGKLKPLDGECTSPPPSKTGETPVPPCGLVLTARDRLVGKSVPLDRLIEHLSLYTGRRVIDKTDLTGKFDIDLQWSMDQSELQALPDSPQGDPPGPSIMTALQEQLGLKLESQKGPVEMFIIDHVERPSEN